VASALLPIAFRREAEVKVVGHNYKLQSMEVHMKRILCILALLVLTATTADAYVRRTIGGGYVARGAGAFSGRYAGGYYGRGYYGHPVARGVAVAAGAAAIAATGWGWNQPYYDSGYGTNNYYGAYAADPGYYGGYVTHDYHDAYAASPVYYGAGDYYGGYAAGPAYYGGYANRSYITGRPTLFPRYYGVGW
jgi:hypothetical protein